MKLFSLIALAATLLLPQLAMAVSAEMIVSPTRIVLEGKQRYATVSIKNSGDAIGRYRLELVDTQMQPDGAVKMLEKGEKDAFSALDMLRASPRSVTLKPGQFQTVRLLVKKPADLADGEYRSHLKVRLVDNNVDPVTGKAVVEAEGISIKPKLAMVIPVIIRHGETNAKATITNASIHGPSAKDSEPHLNLTIAVEGNQSMIGDFIISHVNGSSVKELKNYAGIAVYRGLAARSLRIPLETLPKGGSVRIEYRGQKADANGSLPVLSSYDLKL